jgi:hypothetical protein
MTRTMRWQWAALIGFGVVQVASGPWAWVAEVGLRPVARALLRLQTPLLQYGGAVLWFGLPPVLAGICVYAWLRRERQGSDGYLHCVTCGYILKGLSQPRCPECGTAI